MAPGALKATVAGLLVVVPGALGVSGCQQILAVHNTAAGYAWVRVHSAPERVKVLELVT